MDVPGYGSSIPAGRMKGNRPHRVPLSDAAMAILERRRGQHDELVFGNRAGRVPSQNAVAKLAKPHTTHRLPFDLPRLGERHRPERRSGRTRIGARGRKLG